MKKCGLIIVLICFWLGRTAGQPFYFDHFNISNGLSNNAVLCSVQDQNGFLWFGTKDGLNRFDGYTFKQYFQDIGSGNGLTSNYITCLYVDQNNQLWVGTDRGLYRFDAEREFFQQIDGTGTKEILAIDQDQDGDIWWVGDQRLFALRAADLSEKPTGWEKETTVSALTKSSAGTLYAATARGILDLRRGTEIPFPASDNGDWRVECLSFDHANRLWIGTQQRGIVRLETVQQDFEFIPIAMPSSGELYVRDIQKGNPGELWVATESGLILMHTDDLNPQIFRYERDNPWSLSDNAMYCVTVDHQGGVWAGSFFGGVNYYHPKHGLFERIFPRDQITSVSGRAVREMRMDELGNVWIGTEDQGLNYWDQDTHTFRHFSTKEGLAHNNIHGLELVGDSLLLGTFTQGMDVLDTKTKRVIAHYDVENTHGALGDNFVMNIGRTRQGRVLICTANGVYEFLPGTDDFRKFSPLPEDIFYTSVFEDRKGQLWFTTWRDGLFRVNPTNSQVDVFHYDPDDPTSLNSNRTNRIEQDSRGNIWIATENGISIWDEQGMPISRLSKKDGLPSNLIFAFAEDTHQRMWLSTSYGLVSIGISDFKIRTYNKQYGLSNLQFNYNSMLKSSDGTLYFGSTSGLIRFHPDSIFARKPPSLVPIYITAARSAEREIVLRDTIMGSQFQEPHYFPLTVDHDESTLQIDFAALSFVDAASTHYLYRLQGFDEQWVSTGENRAYYTKLPPGDYQLHVKAIDAHGQPITRELVLPIQVNRPWWHSNGAVAVYAFMGIILIWGGYRYFDTRIKESNRRKVLELNAQREKRLYQAKLDFFSQVAHDIKTPLTLIRGPLEKLVGGTEISEDRRRRLLMTMAKNTEKLVHLTNTLLDFRKIEVGANSLHREPLDVSSFLKEMLQDYQPSFQVEQKSLSWEIQDGIEAQCDREVLAKIIENLLSNALKYAERTVHLILRKTSDGHAWRLSVKNDGPLLDEQERGVLFEPFHRSARWVQKEGSGLGLALAQSFARLHGGDLHYIENSEKLNIFVLTIPMKTEFK